MRNSGAKKECQALMTTTEEKYETLSDLYLSLWKQLDLLSGDGKWLDLRPIDPSSLKAHVEGKVEMIEQLLQDPDLLKMVREDYSHTREFLKNHAGQSNPSPHAEDNELEALKAYLRDQGLRYAEAADKEGVAAAGAAD